MMDVVLTVSKSPEDIKGKFDITACNASGVFLTAKQTMLGKYINIESNRFYVHDVKEMIDE